MIVNGLFLLAAVLKNKPFLKNIHKNTVKFFDILGLECFYWPTVVVCFIIFARKRIKRS